MKISRVTIEDFKKFGGKVVVDELEPGLNCFYGKNEAGKSTLAGAIRTVFLERHKTGNLTDILPWHKADASPRIEVEYVANGKPCKLVKQFMKGKRCELIVGEKRLESDDAEEYLAESLGYALPGKGESRLDTRGVPGLLWVEQGNGQNVEPAQHATKYLREALGQLAGSTLVKGDDALILEVRRQLAVLTTEKTGKPRGDYLAAEQQLGELVSQEVELSGRARQYEEDVETLGQLANDVARQEREAPWVELEAKAKAKEQDVAALQQAQSDLGYAKNRQTENHKLLQSLRDAERDYAAESEALSGLERERRTKEEAVQNAVANLKAADNVVNGADARVQAAIDAHGKASAEAAYREIERKLQEARRALEPMQQTLQKAREIANRQSELSKEAGRLEIDGGEVAKLQKVDAEVNALIVKREATSTRIEYRLHDGRDISIGGKSVTGTGSVALSKAVEVALPGLGTLRVSPGTSDLAQLEATIAEKSAELKRRLSILGAATLADAHERLARAQAVAREVKQAADLLTAFAPKGLDVLEREAVQAQGRVEELEARLPKEAPEAPGVSVADAVAALESARQALTLAIKRQGEVATEKGKADAALENYLADIGRRREALNDPERMRRREASRSQLVQAVAQESALERDLQQAEVRVRELREKVDPEEVGRLERSATNLRAAFGRDQSRLAGLRGTLEQVGASGLGEQLAECKAKLEQARRRHAELALRSAALTLLAATLETQREEVMSAMRAPLTKRVNEYLQRLFPGSELVVSDDLLPEGLTRSTGVARLDQLSYGTQEQLGIIARLAYADLLKDAGRPTLLIFDDAVTHADTMRRDVVKRLLLEAAKRHQILLLTCHPEHWNDLGVPMRSVEELRPAA